MAIASITAWLNGSRDFYHGRMLYEQYGSDRLTLTIIRTGSSAYHFSKLVEGLELINKQANLEPKRIEFPDPPQIITPNDKWGGAPDPILEIRNEKNKRYAQARRLFEAIRVMDSQTHRLEAALTLLEDMDFVNESWEAIDQWRETGKVKEVQKSEADKKVSQLDLKELIRQSKNLATYISKDKKRLKESSDPKKQVKIKSRLELRQYQLDEINRRINELI